MPYRRTPSIERRLAARKALILQQARAIAAEAGLGAVQIVPVAARAGIAAGTVYRYFPSKTELVEALIGTVGDEEVEAIGAAADAAPGPLSALAAAIATFAARTAVQRRLAFALLAEPVEAALDAVRLGARRTLAEAFAERIAAAVAGRHLPEQDATLAARALIGALTDGLIGPLAPPLGDAQAQRAAVQAVTLLALRAVGVVDARARGLVVQTALPELPAPA